MGNRCPRCASFTGFLPIRKRGDADDLFELFHREDAFLTPLIAYIAEHCYSSGQLPKLERATLGEYAPLIGAALGGIY